MAAQQSAKKNGSAPAPAPSKEKPADPIDTLSNQAHARARESNSDRAAVLNFAERAMMQVDELDLQIWRLNKRKGEIFGELRRRGYNLDALKFQYREAKLDAKFRAERDRLRDLYRKNIAFARADRSSEDA
jgi:uncharacterized protein (UPF0335 family)